MARYNENVDTATTRRRYDRLHAMDPFYTNIILELAAAGLKDKEIQQRLQNLPQKWEAIKVSLTRIREIIQREVYEMDEQVLLRESHKRKQQREIIIRRRGPGRPEKNTYNDEIDELLRAGCYPHQIWEIFRQRGYAISRATVYNKVNRIIDEKGYVVEYAQTSAMVSED